MTPLELDLDRVIARRIFTEGEITERLKLLYNQRMETILAYYELTDEQIRDSFESWFVELYTPIERKAHD